MKKLPIRKRGEMMNSPSSPTTMEENNILSVKELSNRKIDDETNNTKQIQTISDCFDVDDLKCVRTTNLFKAFSAPTPHNQRHDDFRSSDSNSVSSVNNTKRPISHLYIQSSIEINDTTFKLLPFELIFDLIFPFLCLPDILQFSASCKLFQSYIFHIIEPNDIMWKLQLQNTIPYLNQLTNRKILEMKNIRNRDDLKGSIFKHQVLIMQGVLQEFILRVKRRIQYFEGVFNEEMIVRHSNNSPNKVFSIPPQYYRNNSNSNMEDARLILESTLGSDYEGFFDLGQDGSIRNCVISIFSDFLREIQHFSLERVHIHEFYDPSQYNKTLKKKNSFKKLLSHHSLKNLTNLSENSSENQHYFDNESFKYHLESEIKNEETVPTYRMSIVGCSERAVHPCILQTFWKNQFPQDYISNYGRNFSTFASIRNSNTNEEEYCKLKLVDMPIDAWNTNDTGIYLKSSDTFIVIFNRRFKSSFDRVYNQIIPTIRKSAKSPKIILVGIDWLHTLLGSEQYESLRYKLSVDELLKLEPISYSKVIRKCSKIHVKRKDLQPTIMAYIEFTPKDLNIAKDISNLMDIILKLRVGTGKGKDFFSPHVSNMRSSMKMQLFKRKSVMEESNMLIPPQPHIFSYSKVTSKSHNQLFNRKKVSIKSKLKNLFSF